MQRLQHTRAWWSLQTELCLAPCWNRERDHGAVGHGEQRLEAQVNRNTVHGTPGHLREFVAALPVLYMLFRAS